MQKKSRTEIKKKTAFLSIIPQIYRKIKRRKKPLLKLKGEKLVHSDMHITEVVLSVKDIHQRARSYGVSITDPADRHDAVFYSGRDYQRISRNAR